MGVHCKPLSPAFGQADPGGHYQSGLRQRSRLRNKQQQEQQNKENKKNQFKPAETTSTFPDKQSCDGFSPSLTGGCLVVRQLVQWESLTLPAQCTAQSLTLEARSEKYSFPTFSSRSPSPRRSRTEDLE